MRWRRVDTVLCYYAIQTTPYLFANGHEAVRKILDILLLIKISTKGEAACDVIEVVIGGLPHVELELVQCLLAMLTHSALVVRILNELLIHRWETGHIIKRQGHSPEKPQKQKTG